METTQPTLTQLNPTNPIPQPAPLTPPTVTAQPAPVTFPPAGDTVQPVPATAPLAPAGEAVQPALVLAPEPVAIPTYVSYRDFQVTRLSCTPAEKKQIPGTGPTAVPPTPPQHYHQIPIMYNFGTDDKRALDEFQFEGCEMTSKFGIQSKQGQSGRMEHSIMVTYDTNQPEQNAFLDFISKVHGGCAYILQSMKGAVGMYDFQANMASATGLKSPIYRPRDEITGEPIQGRQPSSFWKLFSRGKPPMVEQTLFTDPEGKPIPWSLLTGVELKFIPLIHLKRIYIGGGKASIQMEVVSAIVTLARPRNTATRQTATLEQLKRNRPQLADQVAAQLAKLTSERQDQMLGLTAAPANETQHQEGNSDNQPTFAGIAPTGGRPGAVPQMAALPSPSVPSMQEFTANAPVRAPVIPVAGGTDGPQTPSPTIKLA